MGIKDEKGVAVFLEYVKRIERAFHTGDDGPKIDLFPGLILFTTCQGLNDVKMKRD